MYADDTNVTFPAAIVADLETQINSYLEHIDLWRKANKLSLNVAKTEFMLTSSRQKLQSLNDYTININVGGVQINQTNQSKSLGLIIDENLSWKAHIHVHLSESGHLFPCTLQLKYTKALSGHTLITAVLFGMACCNTLVINYKNNKIALSGLSLNQAMIRAPDIFLIPLVGTIFRLEGLNKLT